MHKLTEFCFVLVSLVFQQALTETPCDIPATEPKDTFSKWKNFTGFRLPTSMIPQHYDLQIVTDLEPDFIYHGQVTIQLKCVQETDFVILHMQGLTVFKHHAYVEERKGDNQTFPIVIKNIFLVPNKDFLVVETENLSAGKLYVISIIFRGELKEDLVGFYRSKYFDQSSNVTKWVAATHFEATDARKAFPCFDEPSMKATFSITLGHEKDLQSLSNMPLENSSPMECRSGWVLNTFQVTKKMSTYLVAFMIGNMESTISSKKEDKVLFRIWARKDAIKQTSFAKEIAPKALRFFEGYFGIPYPLPKEDLVALPEMVSGAMENWGLITFRETSLLWEEGKSSKTSKENIVLTITHELAHQWFGNLVTMRWWSDIWLNEGFASYLAVLGTDNLFPEWDLGLKAAVKGAKMVYDQDSLCSTHPIVSKVMQPSELGQIFDSITYQKGAAVIRMINLVLGEDTFKKGLARYLKTYSFENADQDDLWRTLTEQAHEDKSLSETLTVKEVMDSWTVQPGFPVVTVKRNFRDGSVTVSQERFICGENQRDANSCWWIPISYTTQSESNFKNVAPQAWLNCANTTIEIPNVANSSEWVIFNVAMSGLYMVNYDEKNWKLISDTLHSDNFKAISPINRAQLIMDSLKLASQGKLKYRIAFDLFKYLQQEREYIPWWTGLQEMRYIDTILKRRHTHYYYQAFMKDVITPLYNQYFGKELNYEIKSTEETRLYKMVAAYACKLHVGRCRHHSLKLFEQWMSSENPDTNNTIVPDLRDVVYSTAVEMLGEEAWDFLWKRYLRSNSAHERTCILQALGASREGCLTLRLLMLSIDEDSGIRKQDLAMVLESVLDKETGFYPVREFLFTNFDKLYYYYGSRSTRPGKLLLEYAQHISTEDEKEELEKFLEEKKKFTNYSSQSISASIQTASARIKWANDHMDEVCQYFKSHFDQNLQDCKHKLALDEKQ